MSKFRKLLIVLIIILAIEFLMIYKGYKINIKTNAPGQSDVYYCECFIALTNATYNI